MFSLINVWAGFFLLAAKDVTTPHIILAAVLPLFIGLTW